MVCNLQHYHLKRLTDDLSLIAQNYWGGLLNQKITTDEYLKAIHQECGWFMSRVKPGESENQDNYRENTCFLSSTFPYYIANKQFPGIFWFQDFAKKAPDITWAASFSRELNLEEVMRGKDYPMTPRTMKAIFGFLDANVFEYRLPVLRGPEKRTQNDPSDYINAIAIGSPYSPVIHCIESKRVPLSFEGETPERGHFNFVRFNWQSDAERSRLEKNWFVVSSQNLYGTEKDPESLEDQKLPPFYELDYDNEKYFLSGTHMNAVFKDMLLSGDLMVNTGEADVPCRTSDRDLSKDSEK